MVIYSPSSSSRWVLSLKVALISTGVVSMAVMLKLSILVVTDFVSSEVPTIWSSVVLWLTPPYLYLVINCIILSIVASSKYNRKAVYNRPIPSEMLPPLESVFGNGNEKPPVSKRYSHRKAVKANAECGGKTLGVSKPKKHDTLDNTLKMITDGRSIPLTRHSKMSDTCDMHVRRNGRMDDPNTPFSKTMKTSGIFNDHSSANSNSSLSQSPGNGKIRREPSLSQSPGNGKIRREPSLSQSPGNGKIRREPSLSQSPGNGKIRREPSLSQSPGNGKIRREPSLSQSPGNGKIRREPSLSQSPGNGKIGRENGKIRREPSLSQSPGNGKIGREPSLSQSPGNGKIGREPSLSQSPGNGKIGREPSLSQSPGNGKIGREPSLSQSPGNGKIGREPSLSQSPGNGKIGREPSLSQDELKRRVEAFIKKFNDEMRLQLQECSDKSL